MIPLEKIAEAKHIVIVVNNETFCNASAIYTYALMLHKKVSLFSEEKIRNIYAFLPWYEKIRTTQPSGADLVLKVSNDSLLSFFQKHEIKINQKMALALYCRMLEISNKLENKDLDGMFFAQMSKLLELGANHKLCVENLFKREPLCLFRLRARMFQNMLLKDEAKVSIFRLTERDLEESGASLEDAFKVLKESLNLVHVKQAVLLNENNETIKIIEEI